MLKGLLAKFTRESWDIIDPSPFSTRERDKSGPIGASSESPQGPPVAFKAPRAPRVPRRAERLTWVDMAALGVLIGSVVLLCLL